MTASENRLSGGALNAALANELGKLIADFTGRGAQKSRAFVHQHLVVCVLEEPRAVPNRTSPWAGGPISSGFSATRCNI